MRINWFKDENHLVYINGATQLAELERTLHFPFICIIRTFRQNARSNRELFRCKNIH